jgi:hypothetical protein
MGPPPLPVDGPQQVTDEERQLRRTIASQREEIRDRGPQSGLMLLSTFPTRRDFAGGGPMRAALGPIGGESQGGGLLRERDPDNVVGGTGQPTLNRISGPLSRIAGRYARFQTGGSAADSSGGASDHVRGRAARRVGEAGSRR